MGLSVKPFVSALRARDRRIDWALGLLGFGFGAWSLPLPFGRDQGLFYYVGREWFERGRVPYRDMFEQKTPALFLVYGLAIELFGKHLWSARVLELCCVTALGLSSGFALTRRGERPLPGVLGGSVFAASFIYYGVFDFWNTGQAEIWCAGCCTVALACALRVERERTAALLAGLAMGMAFLFKPPCANLFPVVFVAYWFRVRAGTIGKTLTLFAWLGAAAAVPLLIMVAYFGAKGALPAAWDILVGANGYYVLHEPGAQSASEVVTWIIHYYRWLNPMTNWLVGTLLVLTALSVRRSHRKNLWRHLLVIACGLLGVATVISQLKFYPYHWAVVVMGLTMAATSLTIDGIELLRGGRFGALAKHVAALVSASLVVCFLLTDGPLRWWSDGAYLTLKYATGKLDAISFAEQFAAPGVGYNAGPPTEVGLWLRANTKPTDTVLVRGFEPQVYAIADRYYDGRWFWTAFLTFPTRTYRRPEYLAEDETWLDQHPPTYVVAIDFVPNDGIDSVAYFAKRGYSIRHRVGGFVVMAR